MVVNQMNRNIKRIAIIKHKLIGASLDDVLMNGERVFVGAKNAAITKLRGLRKAFGREWNPQATAVGKMDYIQHFMNHYYVVDLGNSQFVQII